MTKGWREAIRRADGGIRSFATVLLRISMHGYGSRRHHAGVNLAWFRGLRAATKLPMVAAGGISTIRQIRALEKLGMDSAVGMALYKNRVQ